MPVKRFRIATVAFVLLLLGLAVFRDFVFGGKLLLYRDIGSDSLNFYYPSFVHLSDYIRSDGIPRWSFNFGLGQSLYPFVNSLLFDPVVWLPRHLIAYALVYQHLLKAVICGLFFFRFLELRGLAFAASLLGALLLSFSAYLCMGSCWVNFGSEVVCFTFVLFATEEALVRGRWLYLPFAVASCAILTPFHLYLCAVLLIFYVPARLFLAHGANWSRILRVCAQVALIAALGVGLAAIVWFDVFAVMLDSPRGAGISSYAHKLSAVPIFALETPRHYFSAILRLFSNDMAGTGIYFRGWMNYFEAPAGYCGLLCLLFLPQVFIGTSQRQRIVYGCFLGIVAIAVLFPWFRYAFWLFQGDYYRAFGLFSVFGIITLSMRAFSRYCERREISLWLLGATLLVLLCILYLPLPPMQAMVDPKLQGGAAFFLFVYAALITAGRYSKREPLVAWLLVALCAFELSSFDRVTVASRPTVTKPELGQRVGYNDQTVDAIREIKAAEKGFYRVTKLYPSSTAMHASVNDACVFNYYGTQGFTSFNDADYIRFLIALDVLPPAPDETRTRWLTGLRGRHLLAAFACEKYVLTQNPVPLQMDPAYDYVRRYQTIYVFRNKLALPFGLFYTQYLPEDEFGKLSTSAKENLLLDAVILPVNDLQSGDGLVRMNPATSNYESSPAGAIETRRKTAFQLSSFAQNRIKGEIECLNPGVLIFQTSFDPGWRAFVDGTRTKVLKADIGLLGIKLNKGKHLVELRYLPPFLRMGAGTALLALLVFVIGLWRWPRISPALV